MRVDSNRWPLFLFELALAHAITVAHGRSWPVGVLWLMAAWNGWRITRGDDL